NAISSVEGTRAINAVANLSRPSRRLPTAARCEPGAGATMACSTDFKPTRALGASDSPCPSIGSLSNRSVVDAVTDNDEVHQLELLGGDVMRAPPPIGTLMIKADRPSLSYDQVPPDLKLFSAIVSSIEL